jgi:hypothetical protein
VTDQIIGLIDAAIGCQQCGRPLDWSPSVDFCSDWCQATWHESRTDPLIGYEEPCDLAAHVYNQHEDYSDECTPRSDLWTHAAVMMPLARYQEHAWERVQASQIMSDMFEMMMRGHVTRILGDISDDLSRLVGAFRGLSAQFGFYDELPLSVGVSAAKPESAQEWDRLPAYALEGCPEHECPQRGPTLSLLSNAPLEPALVDVGTGPLAPTTGPSAARLDGRRR